MPTKKRRLMLSLEPEDEKALADVVARVPNMAPSRVALSALRVGLAALRVDPASAATVPPGGAPADKRKTK